MNLPDELLGEAWYWMAWAIWLPLFARSVWRAPWLRLRDSELMNVWLGMIVLLAVLWTIKAGVRPGLSFHLLGATVFTLCFGPHLAFVGISLVVALAVFNADSGFFAYAINALLMGGIGVFLSHYLYWFLAASLPKNFFIYIFVNSFFGAALTILGVGFMATLLFAVSEAYSWDYLIEEYFPYFLLLGFAEAWLSGMMMTLFVVYRPAWVVTFDDFRYLDGK